MLRGHTSFWKTTVAWSAKAGDSLLCINSWHDDPWFHNCSQNFVRLTFFKASSLPVFRVSSIIFKSVTDYMSQRHTLRVSNFWIKKPTLVRIGFFQTVKNEICIASLECKTSLPQTWQKKFPKPPLCYCFFLLELYRLNSSIPMRKKTLDSFYFFCLRS